MKQPLCVICGHPVEPWPTGDGFGHNPEPVRGMDEGRACDWCNTNIVIPVRWRRAESVQR